MFTGMSAFPLTPLVNDQLDERRFAHLLERLVAAEVDSITVLGSTGSYAYLSAEERGRAAMIARAKVVDIPLFMGVSALRTSHAVDHAKSAEQLGADALLVAPMSYQSLTDDDVYGLYEAIAEASRLPIIVYDNPGTTHFTFSLGLYQRLSELPNVASIKIPGMQPGPATARDRIESIRAVLPTRVSIGISGDPHAATMLNAGCDAWYSVIGGTLPQEALAISRAAQMGDHEAALKASERLAPLWDLFAATGGSKRVIAAVAEELGLAVRSSLPLPLRGLDDAQRARVAAILRDLDISA